MPILTSDAPELCCVALCCAVLFCAAAPQVLAFLRVSAQQALAAFRSHSASSIAGLPDNEQQAYAVRFMREYLSQAWFDKLAGSYNITQQSLSE
jgi:hypothetical protein